MAFSTAKTLVSYAGVNIDTVAQQHMQLTSGQRFNLNAGKGISLFSHMGGITQIAHNGKFAMQSQHDDMQIDSAMDVKITAGKRLIVMAEEEVTLMVSGGAYLTLKGGNVEVGGPGPMTSRQTGTTGTARRARPVCENVDARVCKRTGWRRQHAKKDYRQARIFFRSR